MTEKVKEYIASLRGKKIAFVGMGVANAPSALFLARHGLQVYACDSREGAHLGRCTSAGVGWFGIILLVRSSPYRRPKISPSSW